MCKYGEKYHKLSLELSNTTGLATHSLETVQRICFQNKLQSNINDFYKRLVENYAETIKGFGAKVNKFRKISIVIMFFNRCRKLAKKTR